MKTEDTSTALQPVNKDGVALPATPASFLSFLRQDEESEFLLDMVGCTLGDADISFFGSAEAMIDPGYEVDIIDHLENIGYALEGAAKDFGKILERYKAHLAKDVAPHTGKQRSAGKCKMPS